MSRAIPRSVIARPAKRVVAIQLISTAGRSPLVLAAASASSFVAALEPSDNAVEAVLARTFATA